MANLEDSIVEISQPVERFFGCSGRMLKPSVTTIAAILDEVPEGRITTTALLRSKLADRFNVEVTCPYDTKIALQAIANDAQPKAAYWRVVKANGELISKFPGGLEGHAAKLQDEGLAVDTNGRSAKVRKFRERLAQFS